MTEKTYNAASLIPKWFLTLVVSAAMVVVTFSVNTWLAEDSKFKENVLHEFKLFNEFRTMTTEVLRSRGEDIDRIRVIAEQNDKDLTRIEAIVHEHLKQYQIEERQFRQKK